MTRSKLMSGEKRRSTCCSQTQVSWLRGFAPSRRTDSQTRRNVHRARLHFTIRNEREYRLLPSTVYSPNTRAAGKGAIGSTDSVSESPDTRLSATNASSPSSSRFSSTPPVAPPVSSRRPPLATPGRRKAASTLSLLSATLHCQLCKRETSLKRARTNTLNG